MKKLITVVALGVTALAGCTSFEDHASAKREQASAKAESAPPTTKWVPMTAPTTGITASEYASLRTGMSYSEARQVVGGSGEKVSETAIGGIYTFMVSWNAENGIGNANAMFQDDRLVSKAQAGL